MTTLNLAEISDLLEQSARAVSQSRETCAKVRQSLAKTQAAIREADAVQIDTRLALDEMWQDLS